MERRAAVKTDWETKEMPKRHAEFTMERKFTPEEVENLRFGNVPQAMEDKWFVYMEGDTLFAHRSWTGYCIYIVEFDFEKGVHKVTANRNAGQYSCTDTEEDKAELNGGCSHGTTTTASGWTRRHGHWKEKNDLFFQSFLSKGRGADPRPVFYVEFSNALKFLCSH